MSETTMQQQQRGDSRGKQGVLLYYKFTPAIENLSGLYNFYESNCSSLGLLGRIRLSSQGVNVTIGGKLSSLEKHIASVKENSLFDGTDFKLASCDEPLSDKVAKECGFTSLSIRIVKELVTLSSNPLFKPPDVSDAGRHLSAAEFHSVLQNAGSLPGEEYPIKSGKLVLLDARNLYETRIGKFETPNVQTLDPGIRQYSDLPTWIDDHIEELRGSSVLMYCTGGIRCEMTSAYIRSKGLGFEKVFQLYGGIQRYLEQFPDGGFFKGKNFVFDHRISVGSSDESIIGKCLVCGSSFDDYSSRNRCTLCRMLVLVCNDCQKEHAEYVCELCQRHQKGAPFVGSADVDNSHANKTCNPGNRSANAHFELDHSPRHSCVSRGPGENSSGFKGRTASLAKKLKSIAELVFVNAPHELPFIYQPTDDSAPSLTQQDPPPGTNCNKKYAWLVAPEYLGRRKAADWESTCVKFDPLQYQQQTEGFNESTSYLSTVFSEQGPFDGVLGFSQGAAMAALICAQMGRMEATAIDFRFVILCSGFAINLAGYSKGSINFPSLHIFGNVVGKDRQISRETSMDLASLFEEGSRVIIQHDSGHIIPTRSPHIDNVRDFLRRYFQGCDTNLGFAL
ncbi:hypothetical protein Dimus_021649 [Dionaea muscipula]